MATPGNRVAPPSHPRETITATSDGMIFLSLVQCVYTMATEERRRIEEIGNERFLLDQLEEQHRQQEMGIKMTGSVHMPSAAREDSSSSSNTNPVKRPAPLPSPLPDTGLKKKRWM